jgi:hypothetical protein
MPGDVSSKAPENLELHRDVNTRVERARREGPPVIATRSK